MSDILVRQRNNILWLILNRPPHNLLTIAMLEQLTTVLRRALTSLPHLLVITGAGEASFCAGVDLTEDTETQRVALLQAAREVNDALIAVHSRGIPTVALIKGTAYGAGCELASLCETVIVRDDARFRLPSAYDKVFPNVITEVIPAAIGKEETEHLMQSKNTLDAKEALYKGLVHQVLPSRRFLPDTEELLTMLAITH